KLEWLFNSENQSFLGFSPVGLWFDGHDSFYFVEKTTVRRLVLSTGVTSTVATLPFATYSNPSALTGSGEDLFVSDFSGSMVSRIHLPTSEVTVFAGLPATTPQTPQDN